MPESPHTPVAGRRGSSTLTSPVNGTQTSPYGPRWGRNHDGVDIAAPTGTAIRAAACGTVTLAGQQSGYGNMVCITHTSQFSTCYAHMSRFVVTKGQQVRQGQVIGYVGCTGSCTGPHVHFETRVNGQAQDPSRYLNGGASGRHSRRPRAATAQAGADGRQPPATPPPRPGRHYRRGRARRAGSATAPRARAAPDHDGRPAGGRPSPTAPLETTVAVEPVTPVARRGRPVASPSRQSRCRRAGRPGPPVEPVVPAGGAGPAPAPVEPGPGRPAHGRAGGPAPVEPLRREPVARPVPVAAAGRGRAGRAEPVTAGARGPGRDEAPVADRDRHRPTRPTRPPASAVDRRTGPPTRWRRPWGNPSGSPARPGGGPSHGPARA